MDSSVTHSAPTDPERDHGNEDIGDRLVFATTIIFFVVLIAFDLFGL